jgi:hypothetical protein
MEGGGRRKEERGRKKEGGEGYLIKLVGRLLVELQNLLQKFDRKFIVPSALGNVNHEHVVNDLSVAGLGLKELGEKGKMEEDWI